MKEAATRPSGVNDTGMPDDMLVGAEQIAVAIYGSVEGKKDTNLRRIYHAISKKDLPTFKIGGRVHARRRTIEAWIERQESAA